MRKVRSSRSASSSPSMISFRSKPSTASSPGWVPIRAATKASAMRGRGVVRSEGLTSLGVGAGVRVRVGGRQVGGAHLEAVDADPSRVSDDLG